LATVLPFSAIDAADWRQGKASGQCQVLGKGSPLELVEEDGQCGNWTNQSHLKNDR